MSGWWGALLCRLEQYPVTAQLVRIDGQRWAHIAGASTATADQIALPYRIQLDAHTGLILRGWAGLNAAQQAELGALLAAACQVSLRGAGTAAITTLR